jgi:cell division transport system permease protein
MNIFYIIKEGILGFKRARLAVTISVISIALTLVLVGIFAIVVQNMAGMFQRFYRQVNLEVFINPSVAISQVQKLQQKIELHYLVDSVIFVTPEEALLEFERDFGADLVTVLDENPLPPSIRVILKSGESRINVIEDFVSELKTLDGVDDVVFQTDIIKLINEYSLIAIIVSISIGIIIFIIATLLIFNTIRLTIYARKTIIEIMKLVGATNFFIKGPFIMEGIFQGFFGSLIACGLLWISNYFIRGIFETILSIPLQYYLILVFIGVFLGFLGSYFSVNKYLKY